MEHFEYWTVIALLFCLVIVQHVSHKQERKDLYSRIMARDLTEYKAEKRRTVPNIIRKRTSDEIKRRNE
jgi:hypothetical protein